MKINLACGPVYVTSLDWLNYDFAPAGPQVHKANLLDHLPIAAGLADAVYSSHFLEHIPRRRVPNFLGECHRILRHHGRIRLVLPDFEEMAREYLAQRAAGSNDEADFVVIEIIDQCVRDRSGGELGAIYERARRARAEGTAEALVSYMRERTGEDVKPIDRYSYSCARVDKGRFSDRIRDAVYRLRVRAGIALLPEVFRAQNVSLAAVGERHHWLWDFTQLSTALREAGFVSVTRWDCKTSGIENFPASILDVAPDGAPRKGRESMYIEAVKPAL